MIGTVRVGRTGEAVIMESGSRTALLSLVVGSIVVVLAGFFPWFQLDTGADVSGYRLAELTLALDTRFLPPPWVAFLWYLLPVLAIGGFLLAMARPSPRTRAMLVAVAVVLCLAAALFLFVAVGASAPVQLGPVAACVGAAAMLLAVLASPRPTADVPISFLSSGGN